GPAGRGRALRGRVRFRAGAPLRRRRSGVGHPGQRRGGHDRGGRPRGARRTGPGPDPGPVEVGPGGDPRRGHGRPRARWPGRRRLGGPRVGRRSLTLARLVVVVTVAYLGPPGTFTDAALHRLRADARASVLLADAEAVPAGTPDEALAMVRAGIADYACVPF